MEYDSTIRTNKGENRMEFYGTISDIYIYGSNDYPDSYDTLCDFCFALIPESKTSI